MEMFTVGDTSYRISEIFLIQRTNENGKYCIHTRIKGLPGGAAVTCKFDNEKERDNVYNAILDAIEEN
jgi:hypothetical protein